MGHFLVWKSKKPYISAHTAVINSSTHVSGSDSGPPSSRVKVDPLWIHKGVACAVWSAFLHAEGWAALSDEPGEGLWRNTDGAKPEERDGALWVSLELHDWMNLHRTSNVHLFSTDPLFGRIHEELLQQVHSLRWRVRHDLLQRNGGVFFKRDFIVVW